MTKLSQFNGYINDKNDIIVYNLNKNSCIRFKNIRDIEKVKRVLLHNEVFDFKKYGFIVDVNESLLCRENYMKIREDDSKIMVNIVMTYDCNCECTYCFEKIDSEKINYKHDISELDKIIQYINKISYNKDLYINYFGGEPLLNYPDIFYIHDNLQGNKKLFENITTNGTLISKDLSKHLISRGIKSYQITLDGPENIHNMRRPLKNGKSSWKYTIKGLLNLLEIDDDINLNIRINVDENNYKKLKSIIDEIPTKITEYKNTNIYLSPVFGNSKYNSDEILKKRANMIIELWKLIDKEKLSIKKSLPRFSPCTKDSLFGSFYIDLQSNIYSCGADLGNYKRIEGNLDKRNYIFEKRKSYFPDACYNCMFFYKCMGGCNYEKEACNIHCQYQYLKKIYDYYFAHIKRDKEDL